MKVLNLACVILPFLLTFTGCKPPCESKWGYVYGGFDKYSSTNNFTSTTPKGIKVDLGGQKTPLTLVDRLTDEVENCLIQKGKLQSPVNRSSFLVRLAEDWCFNCDKTQQVLPVYAGPNCKGKTSTTECPCRYRAGVSCPNIIVTTPSMYLYKDVLTRFLLNISDPWSTVPECVSPTTNPLDNGKI